jgi:hypothetical protein
MDDVGPKNAARIWGFISKFIMFDRFVKALGIGEANPGVLIPRKPCSDDYLGNGLKVSIFFFKLPDLTLTNVNLSC